jgi:hypothetical protein
MTLSADDYKSNLSDVQGLTESATSSLGGFDTSLQDTADIVVRGGGDFNDMGGKIDEWISSLQSATPENMAFAQSFEEITTNFNEGKIGSQEAASQLQDLKEKMGETSDATKDLKEGLGGAVEELTGFNLSTLTIAGGVVALAGVVKSSIEDFAQMGDQIKDLSIITGQSDDDIGKLMGSVKMLGISTGTLQSAMEFAIRKGFQPTIENLKDFADKFNATTNPIEKGQMLIKTFGRSAGPELADYMSKGSAGIQELIDKAVTIGDVMSTKDVEAADQYKETLGEFNSRVDAAKLKLGQELVPALNSALTSTMAANDATEKGTASWMKGIPVLGMLDEYYHLAAIAVDGYNNMVKKNVTDTGSATLAMEEHTQTMALETNAVTISTDAHYKLEAAKYAVQDASDKLNNVYLNSTDTLTGVTSLFGKMTDQLLFTKAAEGLTTDQAYALAQSMHLIDPATEGSTAKLADLRQQFVDGKISMDDYQKSVDNIQHGLDYLASHPYKVDVDIELHGAEIPGGGSVQGPKQGFASGGQFTIPPGYPNDTYPLGGGYFGESGETVSVSPTGQMPGGQVVHQDNSITINNPVYPGNEQTMTQEVDWLTFQYGARR